MKKRPRRSKMQIYGDILIAIREDIKEHGEARMTRVQGRANIPYDRFKNHIENMEKLGLVVMPKHSSSGKLEITPKGLEYLKEYEKILAFLRRFGL